MVQLLLSQRRSRGARSPAVEAIPPVGTVAPVGPVAPVGTVAALALVATLHLGGGAFLVRVDLHGQDAHHILVEAHQALHLLHGRRGRVGA
jgi:hypothetical protein